MRKKNRKMPKQDSDQNFKGDLPLMQDIAKWCEGSIDAIVDMCDWYTQRESDGGVLAFKARPGAKILVVAHLDFHCSGKVHVLSPYQIVSSALDDRLGACLAYNLEHYTGITADVVFCDKEEVGKSTLPMLGSKMLAKYNWIVEFDRRGEGAVCYQYTVMEDYIKKHFELHKGTFSDICTVCHTSPVGAFNMAVGYMDEHSEKCYALASTIRRQLARFTSFYDEFGDTRILHTPPAKTAWEYRQTPAVSYYDKHKHTGFGRYDDYDDDNYGTYAYKPPIVNKAPLADVKTFLHDANGNIIQLPAKLPDKDTKKERLTTYTVGWNDLNYDERLMLIDMGWEYIREEDAYFLDGDIGSLPLTEAELREMLEEIHLSDKTDNDDDDLAELEALGWDYDPVTEEFTRKADYL